MWPFGKKHILTKKREEALGEFRKQAVKALEDMKKDEKNRDIKELYDSMVCNIERTPIFFYPRRNLRAFAYRIGDRIFGSVTMGENVNRIWVIQKGRNHFVVRDNYINLPAEHIFEGESLTIEGIFTLAHEYAHFDKPLLAPFAESLKIAPSVAEELLADTLSAKLAVTLGYGKNAVLGHFSGREVVYGMFPFRSYISRAIGLK